MFIISTLLTAISKFISFFFKYYFSLNISFNLFLYIIKVLLNFNLKLWWKKTSSEKSFFDNDIFCCISISNHYLNGRIIFQINNKLISDSKVNGSHSYMQSNGVTKKIIMIKIFHLYARTCSFFFFTMIESEFLFHTHSLSIYHYNFVVHSVFVFLRFSFVSNLIV